MNNITAFGELLNEQIQRVSKAGKGTALELGTLGGSLELIVDNLRDPVPKGEYLVSLHLLGLTGEALHSAACAHEHSGGGHAQYTGNGVHTHSDGIHHHVLPEPLRGLRPGDRVLVAWVGGQPIVIDIMAGSKGLALDGR